MTEAEELERAALASREGARRAWAEADRLRLENTRLWRYVGLLGLEPCQHTDDGEYRCSDDLTLEQSERCLPCCARIETDAAAFRGRG